MGESWVRNRTTGEILAHRVVRCADFFSRGRGLMFRRPLAADQAYLFVLPAESRMDAAIHMFFVSFPIAVIWLDGAGRVVDKALARPWRPFYAPRRAARYFIEGPPMLLEKVGVGDEIEIPADPSSGPRSPRRPRSAAQ